MDVEKVLEVRIRHDLTPFCDPGTLLDLKKEGRTFFAKWQQRRRDRTAEFRLVEPMEIVVTFGGEECSYKSFFASEKMADIMGIAKTSYALHRNSGYIETKASSEDISELNTSGPAVDLIGKVVGSSEYSSSTSFVMITGEAGAGKTWVLKELVSRQANDYIQGNANFVYLYIDAQGRALAKFNEALATELNELRVGLPYHAVAPMVRLGLIVPVVDGFDELIGVGGYDDAFSSISNFVDDLSGSGALVASARSTYYEQEFLARASRASQAGSQSWKLMSAKVLSWGIEERENYINDISEKDKSSVVTQQVSQVFSGNNADLASKPLFFTRVVALLMSGEELSGEGALTERLVDAFIHRELKQKLLDRSGGLILSREQLQGLCEDMAEEMWNQSTRELDRTTVKYIAEIGLSDSVVSSASKTIVAERMPSMAFFQPGDSAGSINFEHEIFFDYFLSRRFAHRLEEKGPLTNLLLGRSAMPESLADEVAKRVRESGASFKLQIEVLTNSARSPGVRQSQVKENCGRLLGSLAQNYSAAGIPIEDFLAEEFIFPGSDLSGLIISNAVFKGCVMRRINIANSEFENCVFGDSLLEAPLVSETTRFEGEGLDPKNDIVGLRLVDDSGAIRTIYDPFEVRNLLKRIGFSSLENDRRSERSVDSEAIKLIDKVARAFSKCNPISFDEYFDGTISKNSRWPEIKKAGVDSGMFRTETRQTHGPKKDFLRRTVRAEDIIAGLDRNMDVPDAVRLFWDKIEESCPSDE